MQELFKIDKARVLRKEKIYDFLKFLKENYGELIGPVKKGKPVVFKPIEDPREVIFQYTRSIIPPKKYILRYKRHRYTYETEKLRIEKPKKDIKPQVIFGIHPFVDYSRLCLTIRLKLLVRAVCLVYIPVLNC